MNTSAGKKRLFISYRRTDADALAGRIKDRMMDQLPDWDVFMDVASIEAGATFRQVINEALARSPVFVALIGKNWLGGSRIHDTDDFVRYEIATALVKNVRIIPVLVNDARMPAAGDLPDNIAALAERNAVELRHTRFDDDLRNLAKAIAGQRYVARRKERPPFFAAVQGIVSGALLGAGTAMLGLVIHFQTTGKSASERIGEDGAALVIPAIAVVGSLIGYWRATRRN